MQECVAYWECYLRKEEDEVWEGFKGSEAKAKARTRRKRPMQTVVRSRRCGVRADGGTRAKLPA